MIPELAFDATDVSRLFIQNELILDYEAFPDIPVRYSNRQIDGVGQIHLSDPVWDPKMSDEELRRQRDGIRHALLLPLCEPFITLLQQLQAFAEECARSRWVRRQTAKPSTSDWESADLLAEVSAVCGEGKREGKEWFFRCPFHQEKTASLHVDPAKKVFFCFGCNAKGGVVAWRKLLEDSGRK